jgi:lipoprotein-anchoring transpeptidase ErfK/SrfK
VLTAVLLASGCQGGSHAQTAASGGGGSTASSSPSTTATPAVSLAISPTNGTASVAPDTTVTVTATGGPITSVSVKDDSSRTVAGKLSSDGATWRATHLLRPSTTYTVQAVSASGTTTSSFATSSAKITATYHLLTASGSVVGVGMPLGVQFDSPVSDSGKAEVERHLSVTTSPHVAGSWGWLTDTQVMFRPAAYWATGTKITLHANLTGVKTGTGKYVGADESTSYSIGSAMVSTVNMTTHKMVITRNGKVLKTLLVSTGRPGPKTETRNGVKVIITKEPSHVMDSASIGIPKGSPGYYHIVAQWAMRLTWSGEFLHSAPWSVGSQGSANVSHGCTNLSPSGALWLYNASKIGDVVKYVGGHRSLEIGNGYTLWNYTYSQWQHRSALAA